MQGARRRWRLQHVTGEASRLREQPPAAIPAPPLRAPCHGGNWTYESEERNAADGHFSCKPFGARLSGRSALSRRLQMEQPFAARRFVHPISESRRRGHAGL